MDISIWDWLLRLTLAGILGAVVGIERESRGHPAGVRTQALVALAAALLTGVGSVGFSGSAVDTSRVASQVVTGIGFIGAGVILKHRGSVKGLTTAATLFLSAALGVAVGSGVILPAVFATAVALVIIYTLRFLKPVIRRGGMQTVEVEYEQGHGTIGPLLRALQESGGSVEEVEIEDGEESMRHVTIHVFNSEGADIKEIVEAAIGARPEVRNATVIEY